MWIFPSILREHVKSGEIYQLSETLKTNENIIIHFMENLLFF